MNCKNARLVWGNLNGPIKGIQEVFPEAWKVLHSIAHSFEQQKTNPYNDAVQADVKAVGVKAVFYTEHADDNDPIARQVHDIVGDTAANQILSEFFSAHCNTPMVFGNLCCSSCFVRIPETDNGDIIKIQVAALRNNP